MNTHPIDIAAPVKGQAIGLGNVQVGAKRLELAEQLARQRNYTFDFSLIRRISDPGGVDKRAVMLGQFPV